MANGYSEEVWESIRKVWETSPKNVSWRMVLEQVSALLNCDVPSIVSATKRCEREKWKKVAQKAVKKGLNQGLKNLENLNENLNPKIPRKTVVSTHVLNSAIESLNSDEHTLETGVACIDQITSKTASNIERLVGRIRQSLNQRDAVSNRLRAERLSLIDEYFDIDWKLASDEQKMEFAAKKSFLSGIQFDAEMDSKTSERDMKMFIIAYGLDPDDFKDREQEKAQRSAKMDELDERLLIVKKQMALDHKAVLMRDVSLIEAGDMPDSETSLLDEEELIVDLDQVGDDDSYRGEDE